MPHVNGPQPKAGGFLMHEGRGLKLCGQEYRVVYATGDEVPQLVDNEGWCDTARNIIYVRAGMPASRTRDVLVHEAMHALLESSGLGYFLRTSLGQSEAEFEEFEETFIRLVVPTVIRLVDDNNLFPIPTVTLKTVIKVNAARAKKAGAQ